MRQDRDGSLRFTLPPPRGVLSFVAFALSSCVFAVCFLFAGLVVLDGGSCPTEVYTVGAASLLATVGFGVDRTVAQWRGVSVRLVPARQGELPHYRVCVAETEVECRTLGPGRLVVAPQFLPGAAGTVFKPTFALLLVADGVVAGYRARAGDRVGYSLVRAAVVDVILRRTEEVCAALDVDVADVVEVELG